MYAIGAVLVVLGHSTPTSASNMPQILDDIRTFIYCIHMPLFFFVAGFLLKYSSDKRKKPYTKFLKNKATKFLVPYFTLSLIAFLPKIIFSNYVNEEVAFDFYYFFKTIFSPRDNVWGHFWFLPTLLIIYIFSYLLLKLYKTNCAFTFVILIALVLAIFPLDINWFALNDICDQLIYFCVGIASCKFILTYKNKLFKLPVSLIFIVASVVAFFYFHLHNYFGYAWIRNVLTVSIAFMMLYSIIHLCFFIEKKGYELFDFFEGKTFTIYILSWPCQAVTEVVLNRVLHLDWFITMLGMFIAGLIIPLIFIYVYRKLKRNPKFINLVVGLN